MDQGLQRHEKLMSAPRSATQNTSPNLGRSEQADDLGEIKMKLSHMVISGFRCFAYAPPTRINLEDSLTLLIGPNGVGKSAVLDALCKLFGVNGRGRGLTQTDFHRADDTPDNQAQELYIEAVFEFPELKTDDGDHSSVPAVFSHLCCDEDSGMWLRIRLEGKLTYDGSPDGDIEEEVFVISTMSEEIKDEDKTRLRASQRNRIHVHYIPATRDPSRELNYAASSIFGRILRSGNWEADGDDTKNQAVGYANMASTTLTGHKAIKAVDKAMKLSWGGLHRGSKLSNPSLRFLPATLNEMLSQLNLVFRPGESSKETTLNHLSDGHRSLFYLSLVVGLDALEREIASNPDLGFDAAKLRSPVFTLLALEEPENHLAPHYLGRIVRHLQEFACRPNAQAVISTHSPATAGRVHPSAIRQLRLNESREGEITELLLPKKEEEAYKFVVETIRTHPEMLFARVVVLGEGETERILLPRILSAYAVKAANENKQTILESDQEAQFFIDDSFLSVVPIRGRHVSHFWQLLYGLKIPFATLLDLDRGRYQGGWGRIKSAASQLALWHNQPSVKISLKNKLSKIPAWGANLDPMAPSATGFCWISHLETHGVFFSAPLDLDFMMLETFPEQYQQKLLGGTGPVDIDTLTDTKDAVLAKLATAVLKKKVSPHQFYTEQQRKLFGYYKYLFLSKKGKPTAHLLALAALDQVKLGADMPPPLSRLIAYVEELVQKGQE